MLITSVAQIQTGLNSILKPQKMGKKRLFLKTMKTNDLSQ